MRISDWSSDVCSSDLRAPLICQSSQEVSLMNRFLVIAGLALTSLAPLPALAHSNVSLSVGLGFPAPIYVAPAPVYYAPPPPVYYYGSYQPAPVVVYRGDRKSTRLNSSH